MVSEWFIIPSSQVQIFRKWLTGNPEYKFTKSAQEEDIYLNEKVTFRGAEKHDVSCLINFGTNDQSSKALITFSFTQGFDEGLVGLMHTTFTILDAEFPR